MNQGEKLMTETESMQLITSMINKAKNRFSETGMLYLFWGWLILFCCLVQFTALYFFNNQNAYYIWYVTWLAPIYQALYIRKMKKKRAVRTYTGEIIGYVFGLFTLCVLRWLFLF
ncbi:MAG: hypothetical protein M3015_10670 [Bacteroidota bacterium]|nr:hypothetical protein [Bacteroidota bacterium]